MISVVIPTLDAAASLPRCLNALLDAAVSGLVREVIVVDGGSTDETLAIADSAGARILKSPESRGARLRIGADAARSDWLLFLHANAVLEPDWAKDATSFIDSASPNRAAVFGFALDDFEPNARRREILASLRCWFFALPYGEQGLLIPTQFYRKLGGYRPLRRMEDIDLVRRIGRKRLVMLRAHAVTSAGQGTEQSYRRGSLRHLSLMLLHALHVPTQLLARLYG